jgi:hypothetical protein
VVSTPTPTPQWRRPRMSVTFRPDRIARRLGRLAALGREGLSRSTGGGSR